MTTDNTLQRDAVSLAFKFNDDLRPWWAWLTQPLLILRLQPDKVRSSSCHHESGGWERAGGNLFTSTGVGQLPLVGRDRCSLCFPFAATRHLVARHPPRLVMRPGSVALHTSMWALGFYPLANDFYFASTPPKVRYKILVYRKLGFLRNASCV